MMDAVLPPSNGARRGAPGADTRLHGHPLLLVRSLYILLVLLLLGVAAAGVVA